MPADPSQWLSVHKGARRRLQDFLDGERVAWHTRAFAGATLAGNVCKAPQGRTWQRFAATLQKASLRTCSVHPGSAWWARSGAARFQAQRTPLPRHQTGHVPALAYAPAGCCHAQHPAGAHHPGAASRQSGDVFRPAAFCTPQPVHGLVELVGPAGSAAPSAVRENKGFALHAVAGVHALHCLLCSHAAGPDAAWHGLCNGHVRHPPEF